MEDGDFFEILESKRLEIIQHLQIDRTFVFDYLRHKGVLDSEDCELIHCEKTTSSKIGKFVDVLARKGPQAYEHLLESLQLEHPVLYEKLTGKEADATTSPIMMKLKNSFIGVGGPMGNSELEILTRHLERTYGDLHEMSRRFEQVVQHKKDIEEQLESTTSDLERHKETVDFLKKKIDSQKATSMPVVSGDTWAQNIQYVDTVRKEISDRDIYIIALQTNLMSSREEIDVLKKKYDNLMVKNDELQKILEEMNESYHKKKCESMRLSERIERQGNEIKKAEETMRKYRECQFHNMKLRTEKERLQEELDELTKWTETLKTRYDIVEYENTKTICRNTVIMADYGSMQEELMKCREEMNEVQLVGEDLRERIRHLEHDRQTYKRQRDGAFMARREAVLDRDKAFLERDQAVKKYNEIKAGNDAAIENKIMQSKSYDEVVARCDVMEEEVKQVKMKLRQTERELEELKVGGRGVENGEQSERKKSDGGTNVPGIQIVDSAGNTSENVSEENTTRSLPSSNAIVESIKRRVAPPSPSFVHGSPTFPLFNSKPIFPEYFSPSAITSEPPSGVSGTAKESPKEGGLIRKGVSRVPIKMRQNGKEESQDNKNEGKDSLEKGTTTTTQSRERDDPSESEVVEEQPPEEQEETSENSNRNYLTHL